MNILVVNDDGVEAKGIQILAKAASHYGTVYAAAPRVQRSASSFSISIKGPLNVYPEEPLMGMIGYISTDGTAIDTLRLAMKYYDVDFDLVISGVNHGLNVAYDTNYSATVALAFEASFNKIRGIAISADDIDAPYIYDECVRVIEDILENKDLDDAEVISVNFPSAAYKTSLGIKFTKLGKRQYHVEYLKASEGTKYNLSTSTTNYIESEDSDVHAIENGYTSITVLKQDRTDLALTKKLSKEPKV